MILSFIMAGIALVLFIFGIVARTGGSIVVWSIGGNDFGIPMDKLLEMTGTNSLNQMIAVMLSDVILALTNGLLFLFAFRYFEQELKDGTPFTASGAEQIKSIGIKTIVMPLVVVIISAVIYECFGVKRLGDLDNGDSIVLGIALILFSMVLKHGAELREKADK